VVSGQLNDRRGRYTCIQIMKYVVETVSGSTIRIPNFIKIGSGIGKLMREGIYSRTDSTVISLSLQ
jgi:hypothetical protein